MLPRKVYSLAQKIIEKTQVGRPISHVLMFHDIYAEGTPPKEPAVAVSVERFCTLIERLPKEHVGTLEQIAQPGTIILTFDDLYASAYEQAIPLLRQCGLPYVAFVTPGLLDTTGYLTTAQLRDLTQDPLCTIGAHSMTHPVMRQLSKEQALLEMQESKRWLEEFCGREISYFAFPYGSIYACSKKNIRQVTEAGFQMGFSTLNQSVTARDLGAPWFLPRLNMNDSILIKRGL